MEPSRAPQSPRGASPKPSASRSVWQRRLPPLFTGGVNNIFFVQRHNYASLINLQAESSACHKSMKQTRLFIF